MRERQDTGGLTTALQIMGAAGRDVPAADEYQAEMFEADAPLSLPLALAPRAEAGKAGRPAGARNKSTEEWVRYFLGRYRSPLTALGELYSRDLATLVDQLQAMADKHKAWIDTKDGGRWDRVAINPLDVLKMQRDAAVALLPYIHKKQPMDLMVDSRQLGVVVFEGAMGGSGDDVDALLPSQQNQGVIDVDPAQSDDTKSDGSK